MYNLRVALLILLFLPVFLSGQRSNKARQGSDISGKQWNVSALFNYDSELPEFSWSAFYASRVRDLDLTYLTSNSGTFESEMDSIEITQSLQYNLPISRVGLGFGLEIINPKQLYHSFQIPSLQLTTFENTRRTSRVNLDDSRGTYDAREYESLRTFMFSFKYEIGKYMGNINSDKLRFGFGFNLSTKYYSFKASNETQFDGLGAAIPTTGQLLDLNFGLGSSLWLQLTENFSLEFKYAPYVRLIGFGEIRYQSPVLQISAMNGQRSGEAPVFGHNLQ